MNFVKDKENDNEWKRELGLRQKEHRIVLRTLLVERSRFMAHLQSKRCQYPEAVAAMYEALDLPKWVWMVEVSWAELFGIGRRKRLERSCSTRVAWWMRRRRPGTSEELSAFIWRVFFGRTPTKMTISTPFRLIALPKCLRDDGRRFQHCST